MIPDLAIASLSIDCANAGRALAFWAGLAGLQKDASGRALVTGNGLTIRFTQPAIPHEPPVWPEEPGKQQKQMHLDLVVDDLPAAVEAAIRLGATKPAAQYGDYYVTLLDPDRHPFCLCRRSQTSSDFDLYYKRMGWGAIPDLSLMIDCPRTEPLRAFYAGLTGWDQGFHPSTLIPQNRMILCFMQSEGDFDYAPPAWPGAPGGQQQQMLLTLRTNDVPRAVREAVRLGAAVARQAGGGSVNDGSVDDGSVDDGSVDDGSVNDGSVNDSSVDDGSVTLLDPAGHPFCLCDG